MKKHVLLAMTLGATACATPKAGPVAPAEKAPKVPLIERGPLFGNPERSQGRVSPDGSMVSWLAPKDGVMNVWVAPSDDPSAARVITNDTYRGIRSHQWSASSKHVLFAQDQGGNENFHVYAADVASGAVKDLTPVKEGARAMIQGISKSRPDEILVGINERNPQLFDLYAVNIATGERTLVKENPGYAGWVVDNMMTPRFGAQPQPGGGMNMVDFDGKVLTTIPAEDVLNTQPLGFNGDNTTIYMADSRGRDKAAFVALDIESGEIREIATSDNADISGVFMHPKTYEPLAYSVNYLRTEWTALATQFKSDLDFLREKIGGNISLLSMTDDATKLVVYTDSATEPGAYYLVDRAAKSATKMFDTRPELAGAPLQPLHAREIQARDGLTLVSYLTLPPESDPNGDGVPDSPQPMVLWVHGGPWARDSAGYNGVHQWLANRGYAVLSVNYRGSSGFGKAFTNAAVGEFAGKMHDDLIDAVQWAIDGGIAAKDKIAIGGGSYGGYATLIGVSFTPDVFACGVDIVGPSSLATLIESFPEYWKPFLEATWYKFVGDPSVPEQREAMINRSAISRVNSIAVPLLVGQGQNDPRVTKQESDQLVEVMRKKGLPVTYVNFPDEGHGFARPENRLAFFGVMENFLTTCIGGRAQPLGETAEKSTMEVLEGREHVPGLAQN
ncbi:MAG: S9 family peptidase [Myxococcota bacterium]